ncbi:Hermansky-Pudlak syndrome 5 protein [Nymphon striatum]|nr:Hermansky-Pudlak syndrome 5 protein [Nymphon striatum]
MAEGGSFGAVNLSNFHLLVEVEDLNSAISKSLKSTSRVKFTCFDVSRKYLVFGANSGGIYLYTRSSATFLQLIPNPDGPLNSLKISPDESRIGYSTKKGSIVILEFKTTSTGFKANRRFVSHEHLGWEVTSMIWSENSLKLFIGDDAGKVSACEIAVQKAKKIFDTTAIIIKTDSAIVQLDFHMSNLLVSNMAKSFLCDTVREQFNVIGTKLRDGEYGACFFPENEDRFTVFSARPGSRLWEVDKKAKVIHTHQFKHVLASTPFNLITFRKDKWIPSTEVFKPQSLTFKRLFIISSSSQLVLAWSNIGIYLFDVKKALVLLWSSDISDAQDIKVLNNHVYTFYVDGTLRKLSILMLEKAIYVLHVRGLLKLAGSLCVHMEPQIFSLMIQKPKKLFCVLSNLQDHLRDQSEVYAAIERLLQKGGFDTTSGESCTSQEDGDRMSCSPSASDVHFPCQQNGVVVVNTGPYNDDDLDSNTDSEFSGSGMIRKWNSLPLVSDIKSNFTNSAYSVSSFDQPDGSLSSALMKPELMPARPNSCNEIYPSNWKRIDEFNSHQDQNIDFKEYSLENNPYKNYSFEINDSDDDYDEMQYSSTVDEEFFTGSQQSQFMIPLFGAYPHGVSNKAYSELLDGIEFDKLKEKMSSTINTGKKALLYNIKELEDRIIPKQATVELFDIRKEEGSLEQSENGFLESYDEPLVNSNYGPLKKENKSQKSIEYPQIDVSELLMATDDTLKLIEDDEIVYDPGQMVDALTTWVTALHKSQLSLMNSMKCQNVQSESKCTSQSAINDPSSNETSTEEKVANNSNSDVDCDISQTKLDQKKDVSNKESLKECDVIEDEKINGSDLLNANLEKSEPYCHEDPNTNKAIHQEISNTNDNHQISQSLCDDDQQLSAKMPQNLPSEIKSVSYDEFSKMKDFQNSSTSIIFTQDPFGLSSYQHASICKLASLCIQFSVLGDLSPFIPFIPKKYQIKFEKKSKFNSSSVFSSEDEMFTKDSRHNKKASRRKHKSGNADFDSMRHSDEYVCPSQCFLCSDCCLSLFCQLYFHLLNIDEMRKLTIESLQPGCYFGLYFTWKAILESISSCESRRTLVYESSHVSNTIDSLFVGTDVNANKMIACLYRLIRYEPENIIEVYTKRSEMLKAVDVLYLSLSTASHPKSFVKYMTAMFEQSFVSKKKLLSSWLVRSSWLECILKSQTKPYLCCKCSDPKPSGHLGLWSNEHELQLALDLTDEQSHIKKVIELCYKYSYWHGYLQMCMKVCDRTSILKTIVSLSDLKLLKMREYYPKSEDEWQLILDLILKQKQLDKSLICLKCGETHQLGSVTEPLTLQAVVKEMLKVLSPKKVISMLQPLDFSRNQMYASFYKALIILTLLNKEQSKIADQILKHYDTQMWSKRCKNIPQQIMYVFHQEKSNIQDQDQFEQVSSYFSRKKFEDVEKSICSSALLEPDRHWGITSNLSEKCVVCNVRLNDHVGSSESGLTIFTCGHTYHTSCVPNKYCQQCACKN